MFDELGLGDGQHSRAKLGAGAIGFVSRFETREAVKQSSGAEVLLCTLFAMPPVCHLGECLGIPWVCCFPCHVPDALLRGFEASFLLSFSELALVMRARDEGLKFRTTGFSWFRPFFTENHSLLREKVLGLPPVPGYRDRDAVIDDESASDDLAEALLNPGRFLLGVPAAMLRSLKLKLQPRAVVCGPWAPSTPGGTRFPVLARALQRLLSSSHVRKTAESWKKLCWAPLQVEKKPCLEAKSTCLAH